MLAMAYVLVLAIVALEIPLALSLGRRIDEEVRLQARSAAEVVAVLTHEVLAKRTDADLQRFVAGPARQARGRIVVVDARGRVIADSAGRRTLGESLSSRPEISDALGGRSVQLERESRTLGRGLLATAVPVLDDGRVVGAVRVTQDTAAEQSAFNRAVAGLVLVGVAVLCVGLLAGAVIASQITRPIRRFEAAARAVADGDLGARAPVLGSSEQRSLAVAFNEMTDRLSESLKSQSRLVADASHQLRTPLTGLRLRLEATLSRTSDPEASDELEHALGEVDRLARTVEELLVLSETGERDTRPDSLALDIVVAHAVERWLPYAQASGHELKVFAERPVRVTASRRDIDRVLDALLENAIAYSPANTEITVRAEGNAIVVRDRGPGLGGEGEELFERFHRGRVGRAKPGGTGLGLAIARSLARRWGGEVRLFDADGGGAVARVEFANSTGQVEAIGVGTRLSSAADRSE